MSKIISLIILFIHIAQGVVAQDAVAKMPDDASLTTIISDSIVAKRVRDRGIRVTDGNSVRFFDNGHDKFECLFEEVRKAKSFVHIEYFNFRDDSIAGLFFDLLADKVKEGVEVRALYDAFGNFSNNRPIRKQQHDSIRERGIDLVLFDPIEFPWFNHIIPRDHRKIVVIDGRTAFTGGMNVADYYIEGIEGIGPWHDLHMRIEGPAVDDLHRIFTDIWAKTTREEIGGVKYFPRNYGVKMHDESAENSGEVAVSSLTGIPYSANPSRNSRLAIIDRCAGKTPSAIRDLYADMIDAAQRSIKLINPYFVPTHRVRQALKNAIDRGVDVQILLSEKSDVPLTPEATHYVGNNLMKRGARVFLFQGGFHHSKMMVVDDAFCTVGSANLDARSLRCDYEVNTLILDSKVTSEMIRLFEDQKTHGYEIHRGYWNTRSVGKRFAGWFANLLTPVL